MTPIFLFSVASTTPETGATILCLYFFTAICVAIAARRLAVDVFKNESPALSPKRPVPWSAEAAVLIFLCGTFLFPIGALGVVKYLPQGWTPHFAADAQTQTSGDETASRETSSETINDELATAHPMTRLFIRARETPWKTQVFVVCLLVTTIIAPITEEFLYRVLFQGTLENFSLRTALNSTDKSRFSWTDSLSSETRRAFYFRSAVAILLPALLFGLAHSGTPETPEEAASPETLDNLYRVAVATGLANVATLLFGFFFLRRFFAVQSEDLGFGPEFSLRGKLALSSTKKIAVEIFRGFILFLFTAPFVFGSNVLLRVWFPNSIIDPIPISIFALVEGVVYWRTRRFATVVGMHVGLNATSFLALCAQF